MRTPTATSARAIVSVLLAAGLTACGDGTGPEADLTQEQAEKVAQAVSQSAFQQNLGSTGSASLGPGPSSPSLSQQISPDTTVEFSATGERTCRGGGAVGWSVEVDAHQSDTRDSVAVSGTLSYDACTSTVDSSAVTLTTVADSALDYSGTLVQSSADSTMEWSSQLSGGVEWSLDGESGTCGIDLASDITITGLGDPGRGTVDATTSGRVCSRTIERTFSLDAGT